MQVQKERNMLRWMMMIKRNEKWGMAMGLLWMKENKRIYTDMIKSRGIEEKMITTTRRREMRWIIIEQVGMMIEIDTEEVVGIMILIWIGGGGEMVELRSHMIGKKLVMKMKKIIEQVGMMIEGEEVMTHMEVVGRRDTVKKIHMIGKKLDIIIIIRGVRRKSEVEVADGINLRT